MAHKISPHFTYRELTHSALALRYGLDNIPDRGDIRNLTLVAEQVLEPVRRHFAIPFSPSSGYRSLAVNRLLGSIDNSQHITGQAVDFEIPTISNRALADWIKETLHFDQLILEYYHDNDPKSGWVHCSYNQGNNRQQSLIFDGTNYREF